MTRSWGARVFLCTLVVLPAAAQAPALVPAALRNVSPAGARRGAEVTLTLDGVNISGATAAVFDDPAITGAVSAGTGRNQVKVKTQVGEGTRTGIHRVFLETPLGTTGAVTFAVGGWSEVSEKEPNDTPAQAQDVRLPATLVGGLDRPGDGDCFRFEAAAGQELVFQVVAQPVRSRLGSVLALLDGEGRVLDESSGTGSQVDAVLGHRFERAGKYVLRVRDLENAFGGDVTYRINAGAFSYATGILPPGVPRSGGEVTLRGWNLGEGQKVRVPAQAAGTWIVAGTDAGPLLSPVRVAVGEEPETVEEDRANDDPASAQRVEWPVTINGRIQAPGKPDVDCYRFQARKGQQLVLEVNARRLGSPLDSAIEVLDTSGKRIERATLRPTAETVLTLSDRDSASPALRLLTWNDFRLNDFVYIQGEVVQLVALPRGPDDDARFRAVRGQRVALMDTTPTGHAMNTPAYRVQIHPPGRQFPPNGMPLFHLYYESDDGGPLYGKDSCLTFTAPADGEYVARLRDVRGDGSDRHSYRLTLREPRPDFRLSLSPEYPNVPAGARVPVDVNADRLDGFEGEIQVRLEGLPAGTTATSGVIEAGETGATLLLSAEPGARTLPAAERRPFRLVGTARIDGAERTRTVEPGGGSSWVAVLPKPDLTVRTARQQITLAPGTEQHVLATITRENGFAGRVPIELKNLPYGVRVLDVGLNGVLITESEAARRFTIVCEPWVRPTRRLIYCTVRTETESPASTEVAAEPIVLEIGVGR